jgi:DNA mismatch repair protein MutL
MELLKSNKESIYIYVNGRYVKSKTIEKAVLDSYYTKLVKGKYPFTIIYYDIDPTLVDVNVHPSKKIVKFVDENKVYKEILDTLTEAIYNDDRQNSISLTIEEEAPKEKTKNNLMDLSELENIIKTPKNEIIETEQSSFELPKQEENLKNKVAERIAKANKYREQYEVMNPELGEKKIIENGNLRIENEEIKVDKKIDYRVIGQLHNMYILVETDNELEIYDQHIVHERILYEKLKEEHYKKKISIQSLLVPIKLELNGYEMEMVRGNMDIFSEFGFEVEEFGDNEILIRGVPIFNFRTSVEDTFGYLLENLGGGDPREKVIISMSCRNAIKAGEKLELVEMEKLIDQLHKIGKYTCPHGRPIILKMTFNEMNKKFNRI